MLFGVVLHLAGLPTALCQINRAEDAGLSLTRVL